MLFFIIFIYRYLYKSDASPHNCYIPKHNGCGVMMFSTNLSSYRNEFCSYVLQRVKKIFFRQ